MRGILYAMWTHPAFKRQIRLLYPLLLLLVPVFPVLSEEVRNVPVATYLTWQKDPATTMTVQWISENTSHSEDLYYRKRGDSHWKSVAGTHLAMPKRQPYTIHRVPLTELEPDAVYEFRPGSRTAAIFKFRTLPRTLQQPIRFVVGGDMYHDRLEILIETNKAAAKTNPHFALVGGDIAYGGSKTPDEYYKDEPKRWLQWIIAWSETMVTSEGFLIPFLPAIGNHDVNGRYNQPKVNAPFFYSLFAYPGSNGYNVLDFGNYMSVVTLDSGHTNPISGTQSNWLRETLKTRQAVPHKFALYHVPAYPSVRKWNADISQEERAHWVPIFEEYSLNAAFEHHDHAYKRTHTILKDKVDPKGVLYLGDGAWGVAKPRSPKKPDQTWYLAQSAKARHFIQVTISEHERNYQAIQPDGRILDTFSQKL